MVIPNRFDALILPLPDVSNRRFSEFSNSFGKAVATAGTAFALGVFGGLTGIVLNEVQQLEHDKGNVLTAHRVDGGYALTQRGGNNDDRVFLRMFLRGPQRFLIKQYIDFLANQKSVPISLITREVVFAKSQIESVKTIVTIDRRETIVLHVIIRQLRSAEGLTSVIGGLSSGIIPFLSDKNRWFGVDNIYADDKSLTGGGVSLATMTASTLGGILS